MQNDFKLVKQIDAMTYNARQAINALNRSVLKAGSYNGFTVKRAGRTITLDRADIYILYKFYEEWEYRSGDTPFDPATFEVAIENNDLQMGLSGSRTTRDVLADHARILYMTETNKDNGTDYWLGRISGSGNPKMVSNTAPIPLNFRAPIYDENLSTKHFSQYETYLFPAGYNSIDILGYVGDNTEHVAGGKTWVFEMEDLFKISANRVLFGDHPNEEVKAAAPAAVGGVNTVMFGTDCYAYGDNSFAGGLHTVATAIESFVFGMDSAACGVAAASIGSRGGYSIGMASLTSGSYVETVADYSAAFNYDSIAGGVRYPFSTLLSKDDGVAASGTECADVYVDAETQCTYYKADSTATETSGGLASNQVIIWLDDVKEIGRGTQFNVGDSVWLYNIRVIGHDGKYASFYDDSGVAFKPIAAKITGISTESDRVIVTLGDAVVNSIGGYTVIGGYLAVRMTEHHGLRPFCPADWNSELIADSAHSYTLLDGLYSTALNYKTVATGMAQTVVGANNVVMTEPRFIVGCGYIETEFTYSQDDLRGYSGKVCNSFVSGPRYSYMKLANSMAVIGVSDHRNNSEVPGSAEYQDVLSDDAVNDGVMQMSGAYSLVLAPYSGVRGLSHVCYDRGEFTIAGDGMKVHPIVGTRYTRSAEFAYKDISTLLGGNHGSTVIWSGKEPSGTDDMWTRFRYGGSGMTTQPSSIVALYGADGIDLNASGNINIEAKSRGNNWSHLDLTFGRLSMQGRTYGALTANPDARSFVLRDDAVLGDSDSTTTIPPTYMAHNRVTHSGFYFDWADGFLPNEGLPAPLSHSSYCEAYHSIVCSYVYSGNQYFYDNHPGVDADTVYDVSGLILPGAINRDLMENPGAAKPRVKVFSNTIYADGNYDNDPTGPQLNEELAYYSDITDAMATVHKEKVGTGTMCHYDSGTGKVSTSGGNNAQRISLYYYNTTTGNIIGTIDGMFTHPTRPNPATPSDVYPYCANNVYWEDTTYGYCDVDTVPGWYMPIVNNLAISLSGHMLNVSFDLNLWLLATKFQHASNMPAPGDWLGLRLPIYPSFGAVQYMDGFPSMTPLVAGGPHGYAGIMTATLGCPKLTTGSEYCCGMVLDVQWKHVTQFDAVNVPINLSGPCNFAPKDSWHKFIKSDDSIGRAFWSGKSGMSETFVKNMFKLIQ